YRKTDAGRQAAKPAAAQWGEPAARPRAAAAGRRKTTASRLFAQTAERLPLDGLDGGVGVRPHAAVPAVSAARLRRSSWLQPPEFPGGERIEVVSRLRLRVVRTLLIGHGAAPALDDGGDEVGIEPLLGIDARGTEGFAARNVLFRQLLEFQAGRQRHALAEGEHLAGAERGNEAEQPADGIRDGGSHDC